jgi:ABC-type Fe3+-siderophore transport system permease subunit
MFNDSDLGNNGDFNHIWLRILVFELVIKQKQFRLSTTLLRESLYAVEWYNLLVVLVCGLFSSVTLVLFQRLLNILIP